MFFDISVNNGTERTAAMDLVQAEICYIGYYLPEEDDASKDGTEDLIGVVVLQAGDRYLPLDFDELEAEIVDIAYGGTVPLRPLTADLLISVYIAFGIKLEQVVLYEPEGRSFTAAILVLTQNKTASLPMMLAKIDATPADALALAVRAKCRIMVETDLVSQYAFGEEEYQALREYADSRETILADGETEEDETD